LENWLIHRKVKETLKAIWVSHRGTIHWFYGKFFLFWNPKVKVPPVWHLFNWEEGFNGTNIFRQIGGILGIIWLWKSGPVSFSRKNWEIFRF